MREIIQYEFYNKDIDENFIWKSIRSEYVIMAFVRYFSWNGELSSITNKYLGNVNEDPLRKKLVFNILLKFNEDIGELVKSYNRGYKVSKYFGIVLELNDNYSIKKEISMEENLINLLKRNVNDINEYIEIIELISESNSNFS